jgi:hypothetical protein
VPKITEGRFALGSLFAFAVWLFVVLPFLHAPAAQQAPGVQPKQQAERGINDKGHGDPLSGNHKGVHEQENASGEGTEFWPPLFGYRLKITDTLIAFFTAGLFIATWYLFLATRKLVRGAEDTAERQLRAYITVHLADITVVNLIEGGLGFNVHVDLKNSGQTPAYQFSTWIRPPEILPLDAVPFGPATPIQDRAGTSIVGPQSSAHLQWTLAAPPEIREAVSIGERLVFVWGGADYVDAFGKNRHFIFRTTNGVGNYRLLGAAFGLRAHRAGYDAN